MDLLRKTAVDGLILITQEGTKIADAQHRLAILISMPLTSNRRTRGTKPVAVGLALAIIEAVKCAACRIGPSRVLSSATGSKAKDHDLDESSSNKRCVRSKASTCVVWTFPIKLCCGRCRNCPVGA